MSHRVREAAVAVAVTLCVGPAATPAGSADMQRRVRFNQGIIAFNDGDYANALAIFEDLVEEDDQDAGAHYWLGLCRLQRNEFAAAAESFERVLQRSPEFMDARLDLAIALIGDERSEEARAPLTEFMDSGAGDEHTRRLAQFFLGVIEFNVERYDTALGAFDAASADLDDPDMQADIAWYRGLIYLEQRRFEESTAAFEEVTRLSASADQQTRARDLAEQVGSGEFAAAEAISQFEFRIDLGLEYDTNIVLLGDDTSLPIDLSTDDDFRFGLSTDARYVQPLGADWLLGFGAGTFTSWHGALQEFNVQTYGGRAFLNYFPNDDLTLGVQYEYEYSLVDNSAFLSRHRLTPSLRVVEGLHEDGTTATATTLYYAWEPRDYHDDITDPRARRDGDYHTVGVVQSLNLTQPWIEDGDGRWLSASLGYRWHQDSTVGDDFDMSGHVVSLRLGVPLPWELNLGFSGEWAWEDYWQPNSQDFFRRNREDFVQRYSWSLGREWQIDDRVDMALVGRIAWTEDDSNIRNRLGEAIYSYDRVIYGLTLSLYFR